MSSRRALLILGCAAAAIIIGQRTLPSLKQRFVDLRFEQLPRAPGFRRVVDVNGVTTSAAFDPLIGLTPEPPPPDVDLPDDLSSLLFPNDTIGVPIAVFTDYYCPNCRLLERRLDEARENFQTTLYIHQLPLLGPSSYEAAKIALAARNQGNYRAAHSALIGSSEIITQSRISRLANELGLNEKQLLRDANSPEIEAQLRVTRAVAGRFGVIGTPGLVIGRSFVLGVVSKVTLQRLIALEVGTSREKAKQR